MTIGVIDGFEIIQINEKHRQFAAVAFCAADCGRHAVMKQLPVR